MDYDDEIELTKGSCCIIGDFDFGNEPDSTLKSQILKTTFDKVQFRNKLADTRGLSDVMISLGTEKVLRNGIKIFGFLLVS